MPLIEGMLLGSYLQPLTGQSIMGCSLDHTSPLHSLQTGKRLRIQRKATNKAGSVQDYKQDFHSCPIFHVKAQGMIGYNKWFKVILVITWASNKIGLGHIL